jgi:hypothetical protein
MPDPTRLIMCPSVSGYFGIKLLGRWVKVTGWMLFDVEHQSEAENTAPGRPRNWRATAWEVHPVTAIEIVQRPR